MPVRAGSPLEEGVSRINSGIFLCKVSQTHVSAKERNLLTCLNRYEVNTQAAFQVPCRRARRVGARRSRIPGGSTHPSTYDVTSAAG